MLGISTNTDNPTINRLAAQLERLARARGVRDTGWVKEMLFQVRGTLQGVQGDRTRLDANLKKASARGLMGLDDAAAVRGVLTPGQPCTVPSRRDFGTSPLGQLLPRSVDVFTAGPRRPAAPTKPAAPAPLRVDPALERAAAAVGALAKGVSTGPFKAAIDGVSAALALAKTAQKQGNAADYARAISTLGAKTFTLVAELVKVAAKDPKLAETAAAQLGTIARVLGKTAGPLKALDSAVKLVTGKTLGGAPVDNNARAEALIDLASSVMPPPVQVAISASRATLEALYIGVGVPVHRAIEEHGLRQLFGGHTPEEMKALISALPTDAAHANATVQRFFTTDARGVFRNTTSGYSQATVMDLWRGYLAKHPTGDAEVLREMVTQSPRKTSGIPDDMRVRAAENLKHMALRFIDAQVRDARGNW